MLDVTDFARLVADRGRLGVLGCLALRPHTVAEVAAATATSRTYWRGGGPPPPDSPSAV